MAAEVDRGVAAAVLGLGVLSGCVRTAGENMESGFVVPRDWDGVKGSRPAVVGMKAANGTRPGDASGDAVDAAPPPLAGKSRPLAGKERWEAGSSRRGEALADGVAHMW
mmetsp:Transcript_26276/g.52724  ORF Transcript_26276/g.52724 Transcript_26276/m.52724 type:complete len:109 (+) Transcript_26276:918-1244(+)